MTFRSGLPLQVRRATELRVEGADGKLCPQTVSSKRAGICTLSSATCRGTEKLGLVCPREVDLRRAIHNHQERLLDSIAAC